MSSQTVILSLGSLISALVMVLIYRLWPRKGRMGINTNTVHCPRCGHKAPMLRMPANLKQVLWGGWICANCGCEFDKYGKEIRG